MDEAFLLRARRMLDDRRVALDHDRLVRQISALQSETPTARAAAAVNEAAATDDEEERIVAMLLTEGDWRSAVRRQRGCFNRAAARRSFNPA
jgi:hypothetical protein